MSLFKKLKHDRLICSLDGALVETTLANIEFKPMKNKRKLHNLIGGIEG